MKRKLLYVIILLVTLSLNCSAQPCFSNSSVSSDSCSNSICTADFNADGYNDLAVGNFNTSGNFNASSISVFLNTGGGTFSAPTHFPSIGSDPRGITAADFNGDNILDLAVANYYTYDIVVLFGTGAGAFGPAISHVIGGPGSGYWCRAITSADFNGDGKIDIAAAGDGFAIAIFLNPGTGNFGTATHYLLPTVAGPHDIIAVDLNNDGILDLATANATSNNVAVLLGTGSGTFGAAVYYPTNSTSSNGICSADFNADGIKDLITANPSSGDVSVLLGIGSGVFGTATNYTVGPQANYAVAEDFDQDCNVDIAVTTGGAVGGPPCAVALLKGNGTGSFGAPILFPTLDSPWQICMADFDKDGRMDVASTICAGPELMMNCSSGPCSSAINEISIKNFSIYPNPATNSISLNVSQNFNYQSRKFSASTLVIQNTFGETVKTISFSNNIDVSDLTQGCYLLKICLPGEVNYQTKFIKQ